MKLYAVSAVYAVLCTFVRAEQVSLQPDVHHADQALFLGTPRVFDGRQHELTLRCTNEYNHCSSSCTGARTHTIMQFCVDYCQSKHCTATCVECGVEVPGWTLQQMLESPTTSSAVSEAPWERPSDRSYRGCLRRCIGTERPDEQLSLVTAMHDDVSRILSWDVLSSVVTVYGCQLYCTLSSAL